MRNNNSGKTARLASLGAWTAALTIAAGACGGDSGGELTSGPEAITRYAEIVSATYADSLATAEALDTAIDAFTDEPTEANLEAARQAWLAAREPYLQTEVFRFYDGPIDDPDDGPEGLINAWPLDEAYIDYVEGDEDAGIINSAEDIDAPTLESLNEAGGEDNIATGFHAIEFLLWGQDRSETGPGARPATDFATDGSATVDNPDRRALYLETVSDMLVGALTTVDAEWAGGAASYRAGFEAEATEEALRRVLTGMIVLSGFETGGERLQAALDSGDQEDEHSCFSDNTHRDMIGDIIGIKNVWLGSYGGVTGTGIAEVVRGVDAELADRVTAKIDESLALAIALVPPFDREIAADNPDGRARVQALVIALFEQEKLLEEVFRAFELEIPAVE